MSKTKTLKISTVFPSISSRDLPVADAEFCGIALGRIHGGNIVRQAWQTKLLKDHPEFTHVQTVERYGDNPAQVHTYAVDRLGHELTLKVVR